MRNVINLETPVEVPFGILVEGIPNNNRSKPKDAKQTRYAHELLHTASQQLLDNLLGQPEIASLTSSPTELVFNFGKLAINKTLGSETLEIRSVFELNGEAIYGNKSGHFCFARIIAAPKNAIFGTEFLRNQDVADLTKSDFLNEGSGDEHGLIGLNEIQAGAMALVMQAMIKRYQFTSINE